MSKLITNIESLVTCSADHALYKTGAEMQNIGEINKGAILFGEQIEWVGTADEAVQMMKSASYTPEEIIDASGKTVFPGFVDSHTHIVFAGNRSGEFARRLRGVSYQEIAAEGGGILTTVKGTRAASIEELADTGRGLALSAMKHGTTSIEIKSGYGLTLKSELNQLRAIKMLKEELPLHISSTFLGAHDFPPEYKNKHSKYVDIVCNEMIPAVAAEDLAEYCDVFIDKGYYTLDEGRKILETGIKYGLKPRVHCDELADTNSSALAAELGAASADHLLFVSDSSIEAMKKAGTVATMMPGTAYFIRMPYAPARKIIDSGAIAALATDCNPGSSFTENMQLVLSLAVINMKMTAEEALNASTLNGAYALGLSDKRGSLEVGKQADFVVANVSSYTDLFYHFGINHVEETWIGGIKI
ncbi:MAG: imidazolonepropionase [Candidatus Kapabacteria bacterium]|jgi:imidazolonepropionase|nr:imidazolonepropionase [Candidatus Kapabacteria bacterium]